MAKLPSLALGRRIVNAYLKDDFQLIIVHGTLRIGKSCYASKCMGQAYDYLFGEPLSIDLLKRYMGFDPERTIDKWIAIKERIPCFIWDDAGYWLFSLNWSDPLLMSIQKYMNVLGTDINTLILTTPDPTWILSKIAKMSGVFRCKITKRDGGIGDSDSKVFSRLAKGYEPWKHPDMKKSGVNTRWKDEFSCKFPDDIYEWYFPYRKTFTDRAKQLIKKELERKTSIRLGRPKKEDSKKSDKT